MPLDTHMHSWPRAIVHIDGDAFFASCEQVIHPEYRGKAVITGKERGIIAAASYEAKAKGVSRGMPLWEVKKIIPNAVILPSDYETYSLFSKRMFTIMRRFTNLVEEYSIDEGFADITGLRRVYRGSYEDIARRMKEAIERELGITVSVGVSLSKVLAKIGSKWKKPAGLTAISGRHISEFLNIPTEKLWGVGTNTAAHCANLGIKTAFDFVQKSEAFIKANFAKPQVEIWRELHGESVYPIVVEEKSSYASISKTKTFTPPSSDEVYVYAQLLKNLENACIKARRHMLVARRIVIYLREGDFRSEALEAKITRPTAFPIEITPLVKTMFREIYKRNTAYRSTGVVLCDLAPNEGQQLSLFEAPAKIEKMSRLYGAIDMLARNMGKHCVYTAGAAKAHQTPTHILDRGDIPMRKLTRLKGETKRKHLGIPLLLGPTRKEVRKN